MRGAMSMTLEPAEFLSALARGALLSANTFVKQHAFSDFSSDFGGLERLDFVESTQIALHVFGEEAPDFFLDVSSDVLVLKYSAVGEVSTGEVGRTFVPALVATWRTGHFGVAFCGCTKENLKISITPLMFQSSLSTFNMDHIIWSISYDMDCV